MPFGEDGADMVKEGYKQTEVGIIPEEWEVNLLKHISDFTNGKAHESSVVEDGEFILINSKYISTEGRIAKRTNDAHCIAKTGQVLMVLSDIPNGKAIAKCYLVQQNEKYTVNQRICALTPYGDPKFFHYILNRNKYFLSFDDGVKQTNLRKDEVLNCLVPMPNISEQRKIGIALSDVDGLIASLEALIEKKRALKTATMQQLLTGKKRLGGFGGEWIKSKFADLGDFDPENLGTSTDADYEFNYVSLEDVSTGNLKGYSRSTFGSAPSRARRKLRANDVIISTVRPNLQSHYHFLETTNDWICSTGFCVFRVNEKMASANFVFQKLFSEEITMQIDGLIAGSNYPAINSADVSKLNIWIPEVEEQIAIAEVLNDLDCELTSLSDKLDKTKDLKQGMMQELLTGKTRLV